MGLFDGKVAYITGGARGMGRNHALAFAREGADIAVLDIGRQVENVDYPGAVEKDIKSVIRDIEALGRRCVAIQGDVTDPGTNSEAVQRIMAELGRLDVVVANAGIFDAGQKTWEIPVEKWDRMIDINLKGVWLTIKYTVPQLIDNGGGVVILKSSTAGLEGFPSMAHYVAAKHGVVGLARTLANEVGAYNIRVHAVCPTGINTPMLNNQTAYDNFAGGADGTREQMQKAFTDLHLLPVGLLEPDDVSNAVLWLASDQARGLTGVALPVDAGVCVRL